MTQGMNFTDYLTTVQKKLNLSGLQDLFEHLGGSTYLKIKSPTLRAIQQSRHTPSVDLLARVFLKADPADRKKLILAYFRTLLAAETYPTRFPAETDERDREVAEQFLSFLEVNLGESAVQKTIDLWSGDTPFMQYTEEQLDLLLSNEHLWRFFKKVILLDHIPLKECAVSQADLEKLKAAELLRVDGDTIFPWAKNFRIPSYKHGAPPKLARKGTLYSINQMNLYLSHEGGPHQFENAQTVMVTKENAEKIKNQFETLRNWIYSLGERTTKPEHVPLFSFLFCKIMRKEALCAFRQPHLTDAFRRSPLSPLWATS